MSLHPAHGSVINEVRKAKEQGSGHLLFTQISVKKADKAENLMLPLAAATICTL